MAEQLTITITAKDGASQVFKTVGASAKDMGTAVSTAGQTSKKGISDLTSELTTVGVGLTAFGVAGVAAFGVAANAGMNFESAMANVNSIARLSKGEMDALGESVLSLSRELGAPPTEFADALYDINSSGFEASDAMLVLEASAVAARAGLTTTATAAQAVTGVLNAYGLEATEAGNVSDILFATVDKGVITFEELAGSMGRVLPLASTLAVSLEELGAAYSTMTLQGISASESETGIAALMTAAINPTKELTEAVKAAGYESAEAMIKVEGFAGFIEFLSVTAGDSAAGMSELTGNVRATNAALALGVDDGARYANQLAQMSDAAQDGAYTQEVFAIQSATTRHALELLSAAATSAAITVGSQLSPAISGTASVMTSAVNVFNGMPEGMQLIVTAVGSVTSGLALLTGSAALAIPKIIELQKAMVALGGAGGLAGLATKFGLVSVAATAAVGAGVVLGATLGGVYTALRDNVDITDRLGSAFSKLMSGDISGWFSTLKGEADQASVELIGLNNVLADLGTQAEYQAGQGNEYTSNFIDLLVKEQDVVQQMAEQYLNSAQIRQDAINLLTSDNGINSLAEAEALLQEQYTQNAGELQVYIETLNALSSAYLDPTINAAELSTKQGELYDSFIAGEITYDEHREKLTELAQEYGLLPESIDAAASSLEDSAESAEDAKTGIDRLNESRKSALEILGEMEAAERHNLAWQTEAERTAYANREISLESQKAMAEEAAALREEQQKLTEEWIASGLALAGYDDALSQINLAGVGNDLSGLVESLSVSSTALDNTFRIIVDNTNALGSQVQAVEDWALELINVKGEYGQIDDLLASGAINLETYNAAQQAQVDISAANADVQEDLLSIQAQQAPVIADLTQQQAAYIAELSGLPEQQQLIALGWMDANTAAQANEAITLAAAAANGEMGDAGYAATTKMIEGAVAANPVLEALLTDIGLVARDHEGNLVVNFDGAEGAKSDIDLLNESVRQLTDLLDDGVVNGSVGVQVDGKEDVNGLVAAIEGLSGQPYEATVSVNVQAANVAVGDGTGGAGNWRDFLDIPENVDTTVTATTTGDAEVNELATSVDNIDGKAATVDVSVTQSGVDDIQSVADSIAALDGASATVSITGDDSDAQSVAAYWAGFQGTTIASVEVAITADESDIADAIIHWQGQGGQAGGGSTGAGGTIATVEVAITGNAGGPNGAQTVLDSFLLGGKAPLSTEVTITANATDATSALNGVASQMLGLDGNMATVTVIGDVNAAIDAVSGVDTQLTNLNGNIATVIANANTTGATSGINGVASQLIGLDGNSATVNIYADTSDAVAGIGWAQSYSGAILATSYIDIVTRRSTINTSPYGNRAHGGIAEFANGGVTARMGEVGPEMLHFADGGTAWAANDGLYTVPPMTYVSPAPASVGQGGGGMTVIFNGNFYGSSREDLDEWARTSLIPAMTDAIDDQRRGQGGHW